MDPYIVNRTDLNEFLVSFQDVAGKPASLVGRSSRKWDEFHADMDYVVLIYKEDNIDHDLRKNGYQIVKNAGEREGVIRDGTNKHGDEYFLVIVNGSSITVKGDLSGQMGGGKRRRTKRRRTKRRRTKRRKSNKNSKRKSQRTRRR